MGGGKHAPSTVEIPLVHVQQQLSWDCGVSAVMMVLSESDRIYMQENLELISQEEGFNKSTWTIDLAYLLHKFGIRHRYSTITLGVNPGYSQEDFYQQVLKKDEKRINEKFRLASSKGIPVEKRDVALEEIIDHLGSGNPAIVLVDANLLFCDTCHSNKGKAVDHVETHDSAGGVRWSPCIKVKPIRMPAPLESSTLSAYVAMEGPEKNVECLMQLLNCCHLSLSYQGHYIVLCGFDQQERQVFYRNPTFMNRVCAMPYEAFEDARKSFGTDEDVLFVYFDS